MSNAQCERCGSYQVTHVCGGLDVPMIALCASCAPRYEEECQNIKDGTSRIVEMNMRKQKQ